MKINLCEEKENNEKEEVKNNIFNMLKNSPMNFIENKGQLDKEVKYYGKKSGCEIYFTENGLKLKFMKKKEQDKGDKDNKGEFDKTKYDKAKFDKWKNDKLTIRNDKKLNNEFSVVTIGQEFINVNKDAKIEGINKLQGKFNYFKGRDSSKWVTGAISFEKIIYKEIWKGIGLIFYCKDGKLKYDFIVKNTGNINDIKFTYNGPYDKNIDSNGSLIVKTSLGDLINEKPVCYQEIKGKKLDIKGKFSITQEKDIAYYGYKMEEEYDSNYILIIDPGIIYSTFLGGTEYDNGYSIVADENHNIYVVGDTLSSNFPISSDPYQGTFEGVRDVFITKILGSSLIYSTFLGGDSEDYGRGIVVDENYNAYVTGYTESTNFPTTTNVYQNANAGASDVFVTKLNPLGNDLVYSTYIGGINADYAGDIAIDENYNAYVTGYTVSDNYPRSDDAFQKTKAKQADCFVTKVNSLGTDLVYSTFLGGDEHDRGVSIVVDENYNAYVTGYTQSVDFPTTTNGYQNDNAGGYDIFVTKLNTLGSALVYSTYLGGSEDDYGLCIAIDKEHNVYVTGYTDSGDFPTKNPLQNDNAGGNDVFITKLNPLGSDLVYSTYLGGSRNDDARGIVVDKYGNVYISGSTYSSDFPTKNSFQQDNAGGADAFVTKITPLGSDLVYSSYLGGDSDDKAYSIFIDKYGNAYISGYTRSSNFPITNDAYQNLYKGNSDVFIVKIGFTGELTINYAKLSAEIFD